MTIILMFDYLAVLSSFPPVHTLFKKCHSQLSNWWHAPTSSLSLHSGPNQGFLSNGSIGAVYLVKILAHCAMLQCMSRYNKPP